MLILASASPRRHQILKAAGIPHIIQTVPINESCLSKETPVAYVQRLAEQKARALPLPESGIILAADTTVAIDDQIFGKPESNADARRMLQALSGRDHHVYTGICLLSAQKCISDVSATRVSFLPLSDTDILNYIQTGEPFDKAGAYAIQGHASKFISSIEGCYQNVVGLPVSLVYRHLQSF